MAKLRITYPSLRQPGRVTFGSGSIKTLAEADGLQDTVFFLSSSNGVRTAVDAAFQKRGLSLSELQVCAKPPGEPSLETIEFGANFLAKLAPRRIVGIGGGSVMDWCRLAWAQQQGLLSSVAGTMQVPTDDRSRPAFWLIPTTCGTGAEAAAVAVYSSGGRKVAAVSDAFVAEQVVLDGRFLDQMPDGELADSLGDTISHAIESYSSVVPNTLAKEAAVSALRLVLEHGSSPAGSCRNDKLMEAGYFGGVAASNCSVGVIHAFAHTISRYGVSHGHANAIGLRAGLTVNAAAPALQSLASRVGVSSPQELEQKLQPIVNRAIEGRDHRPLLATLTDEKHRGEIVSGMRSDVCLRSNPLPLSDADLLAFIDHVVEGLSRA
ncbi:MAG: iron-containing alcohol dehydrogenase [Acidobacteria bacterium]|nr:iron-containing alcohol dehydrogenase [Acidobacteriota bacterium]